MVMKTAKFPLNHRTLRTDKSLAFKKMIVLTYIYKKVYVYLTS